MYGSFIKVEVGNIIIPAVRITDEQEETVTFSLQSLDKVMKTWRFTSREFGERLDIGVEEVHSKKRRTITFEPIGESKVLIHDGYGCVYIPMSELEEIYKHC